MKRAETLFYLNFWLFLQVSSASIVFRVVDIFSGAQNGFAIMIKTMMIMFTQPEILSLYIQNRKAIFYTFR